MNRHEDLVGAAPELAARLKAAHHLEAIGRLSGGVAHDFNNLLTVVISYADLLLGEPGLDDQWRADLTEIRKAGAKAADLARQLACFGREQTDERRPVCLNDLVGGMLNMARRILGEDIELTTSLAPDLGKTLADPTQLHQVLMNLVVNARDAMPDGGRLRISTMNVDVPPGHQAGELTAGHYVRLTVMDSGHGMDEVTRQRIFQPFFTTKPPDRGTGLGLSTVLGIVQNHGGTIRVVSELGRGARFSVYLRRTDTAPAGRHISSTMPAVGPRGSATVLVVEDDEQVRALIVDVLARSGYTAIDASNAGEALLLVEAYEGAIDLLLTDLVMPRVSGYRLAHRLLKLRPDMKVLLMSGYSDAQWPLQEGRADEFPVLRKPVTPFALLQNLRKILGAAPALERGGAS